jgi:hypothetical protein
MWRHNTRHQKTSLQSWVEKKHEKMLELTLQSVISLVMHRPSADEAMTFSAESVCMGEDGSTSAQLQI